MPHVMSSDEAFVAEKIGRALTERDPFDDGEARVVVNFSHAGAFCVTLRAGVESDFPGDSGTYEVEVSVRRVRR